MTNNAHIFLRKGREKSVLRLHPWVFSGSIERVDGTPGSGETVDVLASDGTWLARGAYAPESRIAVRIWTWKKDILVDADFIKERMRASIQRRSSLKDDDDTTAYREIFAESDGIPGLIVDRYGSIRVVQLLSPGPEHWREAILEELAQDEGIEAVYERSDADARKREGLAPRRGYPWGDDQPLQVTIIEHGLSYLVDLQHGHKTGFYLDQREHRKRVQGLDKPGDVLNCFSYTGGFTCAALSAGADSVLSIDSSADVIDLARQNVALNGFPEDRCSYLVGDVFQELRRFRDSRQTFDTIILDPPRFAATAAQAKRASRGYKDINLLALKLLRPSGTLLTFSCSGGISSELFQKIVAGAALDAGVQAQIVEWLAQPPDHPVNLHVPESRYLKGFIIRLST